MEQCLGPAAPPHPHPHPHPIPCLPGAVPALPLWGSAGAPGHGPRVAFSGADSGRTRGNGLELIEIRCTEGIVPWELWHRLPHP